MNLMIQKKKNLELGNKENLLFEDGNIQVIKVTENNR